MRKNIISISFLLLTVLAGGEGWSQAWTPDRIIQRAIQVSPEVQSLQHQIEVKKAMLLQARAIPNPDMGGITGNRTQMLALGQTIEYPAKRRVRIQRAELEEEVVRWRLAQMKHEIAAQTARILYKILMLERKLRLAQQNLEITRELLAAAKVKFDRGFGSRMDVIKGQVELARAKRLLFTTRKEVLTARRMLKLALGLTVSDSLFLVDVFEAPLLPRVSSVDSLLLIARKRHPRLRLQRSLIHMSQLAVQSARLETKPDFNFDLAAGVEDGESKIELEFRMPLALWDRKAGLKAAAQFQRKRVAQDSAGAWLDISQQITAAFFDYRNTLTTFNLFTPSLIEEAKEAAEMAFQAFQTGPYRFLDLIDARRTYLDTIQEWLEAQADLRFTEIELLQTTGIKFSGETQ